MIAETRFDIKDLKKFDKPSPSFDEPTEIGYFSLDIKRTFKMSCKKSLRYFIIPENPERVTFDLRKGYDTMTKNTNERDKETHLFEWIKKDREERSNQEDATRRLDSDFVCRRGLLVKIMLIPYEEREDWLIAVTLHNGTYYLHEIETEQIEENEANMDELGEIAMTSHGLSRREDDATYANTITEQENEDEDITDDEMCCWGWKFEQYITSDSKDGTPNPDAPYNNCEAFYTVVRTKLKNHSLEFSGEVDALDDNTGNYMEFKTSKEETLTRFKKMKWWAQSKIIGVKVIVCGFRDDKGIVHKLKFYNTKDLVETQVSKVCLNALDIVLSKIKASINTDDHRIVHTLKWSPAPEERESILCRGPFRADLSEDRKYNFLPAAITDVVE